MCSPYMSLHGGCAATLFDNLTNVTILAAAAPGSYSDSGVSRNLRVTYLEPLPLGTEVRARCQIIKIGRRMVLARAELYNIKTDKLCVIGEHEKVNSDRDLGHKM